MSSDWLVLLVIGSSIWVYFDARSIGVKKGQVSGLADMGPGGWFLVTLLLWIVGFPFYLSKRSQFKRIKLRQSAHDSDVFRRCPFCAEEIRLEAIKCKHCGSAVERVSATIDEKPALFDAAPPSVYSRPRTSQQSPPMPRTIETSSSAGQSWRLFVIVGVLGLCVVLLVGIVAILGPSSSTTSPGVPLGEAVAKPSAAAQPKTSTPPETQPAWRQLAAWNGSGIKTTESFSVRGSEWRIKWKTSNEAFAGAGLLQIMVYDSSGNLVTLAANKLGVGSDVSYVRSRGKHHLTINSGNVDWEVAVEDQR